ncbi:branched-chain amino acid ABC transporter permease [Alicyclobacillus cycloheptanicus]|uniref:Branched-chain amino acid transport system permease protein n=1 Tax=Alicyclobacillus cycloheptanicus TaxID=1457 RepID=A0ABT9XIJ7_9BACL|nr:branched-chain amino acid ABC transporter permease [Alicyclobacillus cycloheptanicus]MDQ0189950.1 branched-chain amino acid transport system permease protein [Alicyclobacillus cycloheptanicus]WDM02154.1 branched-chain amino acid ABC transporter permease [Alicyclobacillus cycloheptanicus]
MISVMAGLATAAILFIVTVGLSLIFGTMRVINLAHGTFYMLGAYLVTVTFGAVSSRALGFTVMLLVSAAIVAVVGLLIEVLVLRRLYGSDHLLQLLATWAILMILDQVAIMVWGPQNFTAALPRAFNGSVQMNGQQFPQYDLFLIGVALAIALALWLILQRTRFGRLVRAAVQDVELIRVLGVNVNRLYTQVFVVGTFLAALGGALMGPATSVGPGIDMNIIVEAFIVSVIGGLGNIWGAAIGAIIIGLFQSIGNLYVPELASLAPYIVMILILVIRPHGLLGKVEG